MEHKGRWLAALALLFIPALVLGAYAEECPISINTSSNQQYPAISGDRIVWEDAGTWDLFLYNLTGGTEARLTTDGATGENTNPVMSGSLVAWLEMNPSFIYNVTLLDLGTGVERTLSESGFSPAVSGSRFIWLDSLSMNIESYSTASGLPEVLLADPFDRTQPAIAGDRLIWINTTCNPPCTSAIYLKDLATGDEQLVVENESGDRAGPVISGNRIAWTDTRDSGGDIFIYNLTSSQGERITSTGSAAGPAIDGDILVWMEGTDIFMANLSNGNPPVKISSGGSNYWPKISGTRVVWNKDPGMGTEDIYLYTIGASLPCPMADFEANSTSGTSPLVVRFNSSASTGSPAHWLWEFGDGGTSSEQNPVHTYAADGTYSVSLSVGNEAGRDYMSQADYIRVSLVPVASFSVNRTYGIAPLPVQFTDTSSGSPSSWSWDFGDGTFNETRDPVHTYEAPGTYSVSLESENANGTGTKSMPGLIRVLSGVSLRATTEIEGLSVQDTGGRQEILLDPTKMLEVVYDPGRPASFSFTPQPSSGWQRVTFTSSDGIGFSPDAGGILRGNMSISILESRPLIPTTFTTDVGNNLPVSYRLNLTGFPVPAGVNATLWEKVTPEDDLAFRLALSAKSTDFISILDTAYTLDLVTWNLTAVQVATLNLSAATSWVQKYGGGNNITVVRLGDDGIDEVLNPSTTFTDAGRNLDFFTIPSPHGLSRFALVSATGSSNLIQMGARVAQQTILSSGMGAGSSDKPVVRDRSPWVQPTAAARSPKQSAATFYGEARLDTTVAGITRDARIISAGDRGMNLLVPAGIEALDAAKAPLARVSMSPASPGETPAGIGAGSSGFTGIACDVGPDGATFKPPATLSFTLPEALWSQGSVYTLRMYDGSAGAWADIPTTADPATHTLTGMVSHLCLFGVFAAPESAAPPVPMAEAPAAVAPAPTHEPVPRTPMGTFTGMLAWIYTTATVNPMATGLILAAAVLLSTGFIARKRRSRITRIQRKR